MRMAVYERVKKGVRRKKVRGKKHKRRYVCSGLFTKKRKEERKQEVLWNKRENHKRKLVGKECR
jgi:hypothetical protein